VLMISEGNNCPWILAGVYASTNRVRRGNLRRILDNTITNGIPICSIRDFSVFDDTSENHKGDFDESRDVW